MNILEAASKIPEGLQNMAAMFGPEGIVADPNLAQKRADICLKCDENKPSMALHALVAATVKKLLEFKKNVNLKVEGEERLLRCQVCDCELKFLVHKSQKQIVAAMTEKEREDSPFHCWKLDKV